MFTAFSVCSHTNAIYQAVKVSKQGDAAEKSVIPELWSLEEHCFGLRSQPEGWESGSIKKLWLPAPGLRILGVVVHAYNLNTL